MKQQLPRLKMERRVGREQNNQTPREIVEIRFAEWDGGETLEVYEQIAENFNAEHPTIRVTVTNIPDEYDTKITAMVAGGTQPEVALMNSDTLLFPFAEEGQLLNIQEYIDQDDDFDEEAIGDQFKYMLTEEFFAGYGIGSENIVMFYNPALFREHGVDEPPASYEDAWDWDTFVDTAKRLTIDENGLNAAEAGFDPENIDVYGVTFGKWWPIYIPFIASLGGDYLTDDGARIGYAEDSGIEALQNLADLVYVHHVSPTPIAGETMPGLAEALATNRVAMNFNGQWTNATLMYDDVDYNVAALPTMGQEASTVMTYGAITLMNTANADEAFEFFKYIVTEVGAAKPLFESGLWLPTNMHEYNEDYIEDFVTDKHPANYYESIIKPQIDGTAKPPVPQYVKNFNKINDVITPALDDLWSGERTARDIFDEIASDANAQVQGFYGR